MFRNSSIIWFQLENVRGTIKALEQAAGRENPDDDLIFHSDRESQYTAYTYQEVLGKYHIRQSMSPKGNCYDNACMESFFSTLKRILSMVEDSKQARD